MAQISYKNIAKATLSTALVLFGLFGATIWAFGDEVKLQTELIPAAPIPSFEKFEKTETPIKTNLTSDVSGLIAQELLAQNPEGPFTAESGEEAIAALDPDALLERSIAKGLENFNPEALEGSFELSQAIISKENTKEAHSSYFETMDTVVKSNFDGLSINLENPELTNFKGIIKAYEEAIRDLYKIPTPTELLEFHSQLIELFETKKNVYAVIVNYETDALSALLAAEVGDQVDNALVDLFNQMNAYIDREEIDF